MAWICDKNGQHRCEVKNISYNGVFMDVSSITATVESASPISFAIGDYIEWDYDGLRYTLDTASGVEKQARSGSIGKAFVYENLVFLSPLNAAGHVDFLDVVLGNTNDFLTNTEFSFYGTAWDYAKRLEANLCRLYGAGSWKVRIWTGGTCYDNAPATGIDTGSWENKLVDVSGIKCLAGFQQIYELWGCAYVFSVDNGVNYVDFYDDFEQYAKAWKVGGVDKIFAYGKGNGLYKIRHTPDADHVLVTRLRAYGSSDNLPANYYLNSPDYHVDGNESSELAISRLMLPASQWTKGGVKGPVNAYLEQNNALYGVREASVCWDGSDPELGEIKPSIYGLTIQDLLDLMVAGTTYRPVASKWPDTSQRIDKIITGAAPADNGSAAEAGYDFTVVESSGSLSAHDFGATRANRDIEFNDLVMGSTPSVSHLAEFRIVPTSTNKKAVSFDIPGDVASIVSVVTAYLTPYVNGVKVEDATFPCAVSQETISINIGGVIYTKRYNISLLDASENPIVFSTMLTGAVTFRIRAHIEFSPDTTSGFDVLRNEYAVSFDLLRGNKSIDKFFSVTIPQVGFDLAAAVSGSAKLCMRSGANQPREFQIVPSSVRYVDSSDTWYLRCKRSVDQSTRTYFPNSDAVIATGDEYYITGIAMPSLYVEIAARKLLVAATAWLERQSKPRMLSSVEVDNKIMAVEGIVLKEGMSLPISDTDLDITPQNQESRVIDNIRIEEGSNSVRTFTITLRDKKEKSSLDAAIRGATSNFATNSSVSEALRSVESHDHGSLSGRDMPNQHPISSITGLEEALASIVFFELDGNGNVKLKDEYGGLWAKGWIADGGIGSEGGGGGGGSSTLYGLNDVSIPQPPSVPNQNDVLAYSSALGKWTNVAKATFLSGYAEQSWVQSWVQQQGYLLPSALNPYALSSSLATVATTGNYSDLNGLPTLPSAPGTLVTNNTTAQTVSSGESLSGTIYLHKIAKTGSFADLLNKPNSLSGYGITDAKIENGTITLGSSTITPLTSFTETDPTVPSWAKASSKPSYSLNEISGTDDLRVIEALTGTSGFLKKTAANAWTLDTTEYLRYVSWLGQNDDLNDCTFGTWLYSEEPDHFPGSAGGGELIALGVPSSSATYGKAQMAINVNGIPFFRILWSSWTPWREALVDGVTQSISGAKTFSNDMTLGGTLTLSGSTKKIAFGSFYIELQDLGSGNYALHTNAPFYSDQWIADGGIGSGSGSGGLITLVKSINDLGTAITTESLTETFSAKAIESIYEAVQTKQNIISDLADIRSGAALGATALQSYTETDPTVPSWAKQSSKPSYTFSEIGSKPTTLSGYGITDAKIENGTITLGNNTITPLTSFTETDPTVPSWAKASSKPSYTFSEIGSKPTTLSGYGITDAKFGTPGTDYVPITLGSTSKNVLTAHQSLSAITSRLDAIEGWFEIVTVDGVQALHAKSGRAIYSDSWIADGGIGSGSGSGGLITSVKSISELGTAIATESLTETFSAKAIESIYEAVQTKQNIIDANHKLSYNLLTDTPTIPTVPTNVSAFTNDAGYLTSYGYIGTTQVQASSAAQSLSGIKALTMSSAPATIPYNSLTYGTPDSFARPRWTFEDNISSTPPQRVTKYLAYQDDIKNATLTIKLNGSNIAKTFSANASSNVTIDLGTLLTAHQTITLEGGTNDGTLKLTTAAGATDNIGVTNVVTLGGTQTISGAKTFSGGVTVSGNNLTITGAYIVPGADDTNKIGNSGARFNEGHIRNVYTSYFQFRDGTTETPTGQISFGSGYGQFATLGTNGKNYMFYNDKLFVQQNGENSSIVSLGTSDHRWSTVYGINANFNGNLSLAQTSQITLGPVTITYDATNKALHISGTDNGQTIGIYCDGWIADGGIQQTS